MCVCVCVDVCVYIRREREGGRERVYANPQLAAPPIRYVQILLA